MNRFPRLFGSALIGLAGIAPTAIADGPSAPAYSHGAFHHRVRHFERCLSTVGLSEDQQAAIQSIQSQARATFQADFAALKTARERLQADLAAGADKADKSVLGQDVLDQDAASARLKADHKAVHAQIVSKLNSDQQSALAACMQPHRGTDEAAPEEQP